MTNKTEDKDNKNHKWYGLPFMLIGLLIVGAILFDDKKKVDEITKSMDNLYSEELIGIVGSISQNRGTVTLRFKKYRIKPIYFTATSNLSLTPSYLHDFIKGGDSIYKAKNSMEIEIYRGKERFHFILNERIDK